MRKEDPEDNGFYMTHLTPKQHAKVVNLVGKKCHVECFLNGHGVSVLWDTGAQVSIISRNALDKVAPSAKIRNISELLDRTLELTAANGSKIPYQGWVELEFRLSSPDNKLSVPFLVTNECLDATIIGYNVIEELLRAEKVISSRNAEIGLAFSALKQDDTETFINLIQQHTIPNELCTLKTSKRDVIIPKQQSLKITCRADTGPVAESIPVLFEPDELCHLPQGLEVPEALLTLTKGKTNIVDIEVLNTTHHDIKIRGRTVMGTLQLVQSVTPLEVQLKQPEEKADAPMTPPAASSVPASPNDSGNDSGEPTVIPQHIKDLNLGELRQDQKEIAWKMLAEEADSLAKDDDDIGCIEDLQMSIELDDRTPVQKNYVAVPRPLYPEVKSYIADLLNRKFIRPSKSSYSSPVVCVRKKDQSLRLCVDYRALNKKTIPDRHPIPRVQESLDNLGGNKWFSVLDQGKA
ncbi:hypothetical protein QZH41_005170 [Actinostola sp. cb2023]|nr:hypothetical protein QZH41_005170 [Actinostola sp. cb2023]